MLIEFSVANFRSFRAKQTFSMVAAPRIRKGLNVFPAPLKEKGFPPLLKAAVIYGPNASGKSNLLRAMSVISIIARRSPDNNSPKLPVKPFAFDENLKDQPSEFEIHFISNEMRYEFNLNVSENRIYKEELKYFPLGKEKLIYSRVFSGEIEEYKFEDIKTSKQIYDTWIKLTPPKVLFISQAVANSDNSENQLKNPYEWLSNGIFTIMDGMGDLIKQSQELIASEEKTKLKSFSQYISEFLQEVDIPIADVNVETTSRTLPSSIIDEALINSLPVSQRVINKQTLFLTHATALGKHKLSIAEQSDGTKNLIGFWLPWFVRDLQSQAQRVLSVDELDNSLHPLIVENLVKKHLEASMPTQLIFTTHDTHLMQRKMLRRDQIWITERDIDGATKIRSIHDFIGRESEDVEKRYFAGKYRGLPFIKG